MIFLTTLPNPPARGSTFRSGCLSSVAPAPTRQAWCGSSFFWVSLAPGLQKKTFPFFASPVLGVVVSDLLLLLISGLPPFLSLASQLLHQLYNAFLVLNTLYFRDYIKNSFWFPGWARRWFRLKSVYSSLLVWKYHRFMILSQDLENLWQKKIVLKYLLNKIIFSFP